MKRVGAFFFAFLPFIIAFGIQGLGIVYILGTGELLSSIHRFPQAFPLIRALTDTEYMMAGLVIYSLLSICLYGLWYYLRCGGKLSFCIGEDFHPLTFASLVILVPGIQFFTSILISILASIDFSMVENYSDLIEDSGLNDFTFVIAVYAVILGPICEELIFRGVTLQLFKRACPFRAANIIQALLFGIYHGNLVQGIYAFALGLLLGYICESSGHIYYSILLHILYNFHGTFVTMWLEDLYEQDWFTVVMLVVMAVSLGIGLFLYRKSIRKMNARKARLSYLRENFELTR